MSWYTPWSEGIKKRACRYLLQRYLGNFLEEKLTLEQLNVDLYNGTGTVLDVSLDCEALNELGDSMNWPFEIIDGHVKEITVTIPWSTIFKDDSVVEINGLTLSVQPKVRAEPVASMLDSMWSSMSSSMQLAAECLQEETSPQNANPLEGIEMFAHAIDSILSRIKIKFTNTKVRLEHVSKTSERGIALEILIKNIDYYDETEVINENSSASEKTPEATNESTKTYTNVTYLKKKLRVKGVTFYIHEFLTKLRNAPCYKMDKSVSSQNYQSTISDIFYEASSGEKLSDAPRASTPDEKVAQTDPIVLAKILGEQEIYISIKHLEEVEGAKINIKISLASLILLITPDQLNSLLELFDILSQPNLEDTSNLPIRYSNTQCKQMKSKDFHFIEAQLLSNFNKQHSAPPGPFGWSGPSFEDNDDEGDKFHPMTSQDDMPKSLTSSVSSMSTSVTSSVNIPSYQPKVTKNKKVPNIDDDPTAEVSHINVKIASLSCVLLHKNIVVPMPIGTPYISTASALKLQEISTEFFNRIETLGKIDESYDITTINEALDKGTERDHLRILLTEVNLDGSERITSRGIKTMFEADVKRMLVRECLYYQREDPEDTTPQHFDLIWFEYPDDESAAAAVKPDVTLIFKHTSKYMRISGEKQPANPTTDVLVKCSPFYVDVDLTLVERMSATFFGPSTAATSTTPQTKNQTNISIQSPKLNVILRFPVADVRPGAAGAAGGARRVRRDWLRARFDNAALDTQRRAAAPAAYTLKATNIDLYYHENENLPPTHIAQSCMDVASLEDNILSSNTTNTTQALPMISLTMKPREPSNNFFESLQEETHFEPTASNPMTTSVYMMDNLRSSRPSPFSGKKMVHQSLTKDENDKKEEEIIVPGTEEEMTEFTNDSVEHSAVHLDFNLPILSLQIESKHLYEIIYNRVNSDLLLWEPHLVDEFDISPHLPIHPTFGACKGMGYDSDTESTASDDDKLFISTHDDKLRRVHRKLSEKETDTHNFCLTLKVGKGLMTIFAPVRDSNKRVVPGQMGELVLNADKLSLCHVSGLNGRSKTARLSLRAGKTVLFHEPILTIPSEKPKLRLYGTTLPSYLKTTIYPSGKGVIIKDNLMEKDMFTMALRIDPKIDTPNGKSLCIALSVEQATLRHRGAAGAAWLAQLLDVLDVLDYPVPGYAPGAVFSELHAHVADCAVDYRPLYLPIRTILTLGNFSYSSNIIPETNASILRFLAQECTLFLSHQTEMKCNTRALQEDKKPPNIHKDYVCVVDVGLFELAIRTEDKNSHSRQQPQVELTASNNMVNIYTCWDSASALCRLVTYIATDGDSQPPLERSRQTSICSDHGVETLVGLDDRPVEEILELSPSEMQQVNNLMEEAMKESPNSTLDEDDFNSSTEKEGVEVFFFPDEENVKQKKRTSSLSVEPGLQSAEYDECPPVNNPDNSNISRDLGNSTLTPKSTPRKSKRSKKKKSTGEDKNTDDEYCIVEENFYSEDDEMAEPVVKWIKESYMVDGYFAAKEMKADVLQAPKSFPLPTTRYTLCELSVTWNLFAGNDFHQTSDTTSTKKTVSIDDTRRHGSPTVSKRGQEQEYEAGRAVTAAYRAGGVRYAAGAERVRPPPAARRNLRTRGGPRRDHRNYVRLCLGKVKFQHEVYPQGGTYASRQTLAIAKIEVLDRILCSDINKLLSHHTRKDEPERINAHMLVIKAVHLRVNSAVPTQECCLKISLLPLWINLDQDTMSFIVNFFNKLGSDDVNDDDTKSLGGLSTETTGSRQTTPTHRPPVMSLGSGLRDPPPTPTSIGDADCLSLNESVMPDNEPIMENYEAERLVSNNLIQLEEDFQRLGIDQEKPPTKVPDSEPTDNSPIYFRRVVFSPEVPIRLDYVGKRIDVTKGTVTSLIMGLGTLQYSEMTLKRIDYRYGLLGYEKLIQYCVSEWLSDIKRNQLPGLLSGLGPMHAVLQIITGICDLLWLPVEQWRRDGRLVHGLRRGAASFTARTAVAALDITARLLHLIQATAETACDMLTPSPTLLALRERNPRRRRDSRPPADIREGVNSAYNTVREGIAEAAATMAAAARDGSGAGVLRHLPGAAVAPLALAAAGAADLLGGVRAHLAPHAARDHADKWRAPPPDAVD